MSLRDQLIAKGLVSKKRAQHIDRELKHERKSSKANKKRKQQAEREAAEAEAAKVEAERRAREEARATAAAAREAHEHIYRVRQIVMGNRMGARGVLPFHYRKGDGRFIGCMKVSDAVARDLRTGRLAIATLQERDGTYSHHLISRQGALKLADVAPESLVHWVNDTEHLGDPSQAPYTRTWDTTGWPHRVRDEAELARGRSL